MARYAALCALTGLLLGAVPAQAFDHSAFDELLAQCVQQGRVNYAGVKAKRGVLDTYLRELATVNTAALSRKERLAFWINSYNAAVLSGVLDAGVPASVKDIKGFFDKQTRAIGGEMLTLNQMKDRGRALGDWRIHFALVGAALGDPPLRDEAYHPDWLDAQLAEQTRAYLADPAHGLRLDAKGRTLWAAKIFQAYAKDFVPQGSLNSETLLQVIEPYLNPLVAVTLRERPVRLKFIDYDWALNSRAR